MENSELDLYDIYLSAKGDPKIKAVAADMAKELGKGNKYPDFLQKLAQYEVALTKFFENNLGASEYAYLQINVGLFLRSFLGLFRVMLIHDLQHEGYLYPVRWIYMAF